MRGAPSRDQVSEAISAAGVALKLNPRLDRIRNRRPGSCEETVWFGWIQRPHFAGFVERDQLIAPGELGPQLEIHEGVWFPLIGACILTETRVVHRAYRRTLKRARDDRPQEGGEDDYGDEHPLSRV